MRSKGEKLPTEPVRNRILIPRLPNDIALGILVRVPRILQARCRMVCRSWRQAMEPAAMHLMRKMLYVPEVWLVSLFLFSSRPYTPFRVFDVLGDRSYSIPLSCHEWSDSTFLVYSYFSTVGYEVLIAATPKCRYISGQGFVFSGQEMEGLYSFDALRMEWNDGKYSHLPRGARACAVDMEGGYLYASRRSAGHTSGGFTNKILRLDLKTKMWEELPGYLHTHREDFQGVMLQNRLCMLTGCKDERNPQGYSTNLQWTLVPDVWPVGITGSYSKYGTVVLMDRLYCLRDSPGSSTYMELICYETSSAVWNSLGNVPASEDRTHQIGVHGRTLLAVGEELWVSSRVCRTIWTTKPSASQPLYWKSRSTGTCTPRHMYSLHVATMLV